MEEKIYDRQVSTWGERGRGRGGGGTRHIRSNESPISQPEPAFLVVSNENLDSGQVQFLSMRTIMMLIIDCQPISFERNAL